MHSFLPWFNHSFIHFHLPSDFQGFRSSFATNLVRKSCKTIIYLQIAPQNTLYFGCFSIMAFFGPPGPKDALGWSGQTKEGCGILGITSKEARLGMVFKYPPGNGSSISHLEKRKIGDTLVPRRVVVWSKLRYAKKHPSLSLIVNVELWCKSQSFVICDRHPRHGIALKPVINHGCRIKTKLFRHSKMPKKELKQT